MKITPLDIQQHEFRRRLTGYDYQEVNTFLELITHEWENIIRDNKRLKDNIALLERQLLEHKERETILKETLMTAQKVTHDIKNSAQKESEIIVNQAKVQAEKIINLANQRLARLIDDINEMKRQRARLESTIRSVLDAHSQMLDTMHDGEKEQTRPEETIKIMPAKNS